MASVKDISSNAPAQSKPPSAAECYRCWTAYDALKEATAKTNYRSVWSILSCSCCLEPHCWQSQEVLPIAENLRARIRWYDNVQLPPPFAVEDGGNPSKSQLTPEEFHALQVHFVSHHQRIELILHCLKPSLDRIYTTVTPFVDHINDFPEDLVNQVVDECKYTSNGWYAVGQLVRGVALMDRMNYLAYVPRLAGVSGGNSPLMMPLSFSTGNLESLFKMINTEDIAIAIQSRAPLGRLAEAFIDCLDSLSRCWFDHVVTATTAIGITKGTKGTPNTILVDRVLKRLHESKLLAALGSLRAPITGIGVEMHQLCNYQDYPLADHYLDLFVDPGPEFGSHSIGWLPKEYERARADFLELRRKKRTDLWEHFYSETRPLFCQTLKKLMCLDESVDRVGFGLGSSVTEVLSRLVGSIQLATSNFPLCVLLADDEFVTLQRAAAILGRRGAVVECLPVDELQERILRNSRRDEVDEKKENYGSIRQLVLLSLVNSCTQRVQNVNWITKVPTDTVFIIDITQAIANIPLSPHCMEELVSRPNIFFVGSLIKHARCGENLGFMTYAEGSGRLLDEPMSGWTSYLSGLQANETADVGVSNRLYYDVGIEWDGGTPSWVEAAYVANRIIKAMPPIEAQHKYVKQIQAAFIGKAGHLLNSKQVACVSESNTLSLPVPRVLPEKLPFGLDYKIVNGISYLRIGFGVHNLDYHLIELLKFLEEFHALE